MKWKNPDSIGFLNRSSLNPEKNNRKFKKKYNRIKNPKPLNTLENLLNPPTFSSKNNQDIWTKELI